MNIYPHKNLVILNTLTLGGVILVNILAGTGQIAGTDVGEVSRRYDTLFAPAGYAFSIWGFIYVLLIGFIGFQWGSLIKKINLEVIDQTGVWFIISNLANAGWLFLWLNEFIGLSLAVMLVLLLSLIMLAVRLRMELWDAPVRILMFVWWPLAVYLGWIIVATIANFAAFVASIGWDGYPLSAQLWTIILIALSTAIYLFLIYSRNLRESAAVGIWAFVAIAVRQGGDNPEITIAALVASALLLAAIAYQSYQNRSTSPFIKLQRGEF